MTVPDSPASANEAVNQNYVDNKIGGLNLQPNLGTTLTGTSGDGYVIVWDETTQTFVAQAPGDDATKLNLSGGTMSGAINMAENDITNIGDLTGIDNLDLVGSGTADFNDSNLVELGYVTVMPERSIHLGSFTDVQETTYTGTLGAADAGKVCLLYTSPSPRDQRGSRMPSSA